ncbi:arsenic resistance protein [Gordonia jinghuaiqii]|uniref:Arsenic resistance protein n=1 Tax=Gordonia jinghuaiqii TaxID=2758710 RepID=A0A7D7LVI0_9ACTN|nr:bile acid:sodium symporter [Gordonia jinghuaiqii]QMS99915.1 arsenic resistance protein [Gordonia jinghuaiqii]
MSAPATMTARLERHQVVLYLAAIAAGLGAGLTFPTTAEALDVAVTPLLVALLYVTFLQVRASDLLTSLRDRRFMTAVLIINFVVAPAVVAALSPLLPADDAIRVGAMLVLLSPCVDYVVVFTGLAGGDHRRLLAATPLLLLAQMLLTPVYLTILLGDRRSVIDPEPFLWAFLVLIVLPLASAWLTQAWAARSDTGRAAGTAAGTTMVPLMIAVLFVAVCSQVPRIDGRFGEIAGFVPVYVAFLVLMAVIGLVLARGFRLRPKPARAVVFSGATRNSLVVLPLALALPVGAELAAATVITQTLVELAGMVVLVWAFTCGARRR